MNKRPSRAQIHHKATATTAAAPPLTKIDIDTDSWIDKFKNGGMDMHPDFEAYNYMPILDDLVYSGSFHCATTTTTVDEIIMNDENIFNFYSLLN